MIRLDDLQFNGLKLYQDTELDRFSEDAVMLANFLRLTPGDRVVDIGCGNGILSILGAEKTGARFTGIDRQPAQVELARRSACLNGQDLSFYEMDIEAAPAALGYGKFTAAVMNPPYFAAGDLSKNSSRGEARHGALEAFVVCAGKLVQNGGRIFLCYPVLGLTDLCWLMRREGLEPKRLSLFSPNAARAPRRLLMEGKKGAGPGLQMDPILF
jgi:tRNA1Val (adenine37-N6)-methyltransferase